MIKQVNGVYRFTTRSPLADAVMFLWPFGGLALLFMGLRNKPVMWSIVAVGAGCLILGALLLFVFKFQKLVAEISEAGIMERASKVSKGIIRWEEIASVSVYQTFGTNSLSRDEAQSGGQDQFVGIFLVDADEYAKRLNFAQRSLLKMNLKLKQAPINIPCNLLCEDTEKFVELCKTKIGQGQL